MSHAPLPPRRVFTSPSPKVLGVTAETTSVSVGCGCWYLALLPLYHLRRFQAVALALPAAKVSRPHVYFHVIAAIGAMGAIGALEGFVGSVGD